METRDIMMAHLPHRTWAAFCSKAEITAKKLRGQTEDEYSYGPYYWIIDGTLYTNSDQNQWKLASHISWSAC